MFGGKLGYRDTMDDFGYGLPPPPTCAVDRSEPVLAPAVLPSGFCTWSPAALDAYARVHVASCELERRKVDLRIREIDLEIASRESVVGSSVSPPSEVTGSAAVGLTSGVACASRGVRVGGVSQVARVGSWRAKVVARASSAVS